MSNNQLHQEDALIERIFNRPTERPVRRYRSALGFLAGVRKDDAPTRKKMAELVRRIAQDGLQGKTLNVDEQIKLLNSRVRELRALKKQQESESLTRNE